MDKDYLCEKLREAKKDSKFRLGWDRGNGPLEQTVSFQGFDENNNPLLKIDDSVILSIEKIGGYRSINSCEEIYASNNLKN